MLLTSSSGANYTWIYLLMTGLLAVMVPFVSYVFRQASQSLKENTQETTRLARVVDAIQAEQKSRSQIVDMKFAEQKALLDEHSRSDREQFRDLGRELHRLTMARGWGLQRREDED